MQDFSSSVDGTWPNNLSDKIHGDIYDDCGGKNYIFKEGVYSLFTKVLLPVLKDKIKLNTEVSSIDWSSNPVKVSTLDGENYTADHVLITPSIGYLKDNHVELFTPKLPSEKCQALQGLSLGVSEKIMLLFDEPCLREKLKENPSFQAYGYVFREDESFKLLTAKMKEIIGENVSISILSY